MISFLDDQVGIIIEKIKKWGLIKIPSSCFQATMVQPQCWWCACIFLQQRCRIKGIEMDVYEGGIRVPFIVRWPGKISETLPAILHPFNTI